jgi:hypothetical protein
VQADYVGRFGRTEMKKNVLIHHFSTVSILQTASAKLTPPEITQTVSRKLPEDSSRFCLSWPYFVFLPSNEELRLKLQEWGRE